MKIIDNKLSIEDASPWLDVARAENTIIRGIDELKRISDREVKGDADFKRAMNLFKSAIVNLDKAIKNIE